MSGEYRDSVKDASNKEALDLLRTDPAEYFRRARAQTQPPAWWGDLPESLLDEEHRRLARSERRWERRMERRASIAAALRRLADRIHREDEL